MTKTSKTQSEFGNITVPTMSTAFINVNQTYLRDININSVSKDKKYLLIKTGNVINRLKISDVRKIINLVMETESMIQSKKAKDTIYERSFYSERHSQYLIDIRDAASAVEVAEEEMKDKALKALCRSCIKYRQSDGLCVGVRFCEDCPMPVTYCKQCAEAKIADDYMCYRKKKFMEHLNGNTNESEDS